MGLFDAYTFSAKSSKWVISREQFFKTDWTKLDWSKVPFEKYSPADQRLLREIQNTDWSAKIPTKNVDFPNQTNFILPNIDNPFSSDIYNYEISTFGKPYVKPKSRVEFNPPETPFKPNKFDWFNEKPGVLWPSEARKKMVNLRNRLLADYEQQHGWLSSIFELSKHVVSPVDKDQIRALNRALSTPGLTEKQLNYIHDRVAMFGSEGAGPSNWLIEYAAGQHPEWTPGSPEQKKSAKDFFRQKLIEEKRKEYFDLWSTESNPAKAAEYRSKWEETLLDTYEPVARKVIDENTIQPKITPFHNEITWELDNGSTASWKPKAVSDFDKQTLTRSLPVVFVDFETTSTKNNAQVLNIGSLTAKFDFVTGQLVTDTDPSKVIYNRYYLPDYRKRSAFDVPGEDRRLTPEDEKYAQEEFDKSDAVQVNKFTTANLLAERSRTINSGAHPVTYDKYFNQAEIENWVKFITDNGKKQVIIAGHNIEYDSQFINEAFIKITGREPIYIDTMMSEATPELHDIMTEADTNVKLRRKIEQAKYALKYGDKFSKDSLNVAQIKGAHSLEAMFNQLAALTNKWSPNTNWKYERHQSLPDVFDTAYVSEQIFKYMQGYTAMPQIFEEYKKLLIGQKSVYGQVGRRADFSYEQVPITSKVYLAKESILSQDDMRRLRWLDKEQRKWLAKGNTLKQQEIVEEMERMTKRTWQMTQTTVPVKKYNITSQIVDLTYSEGRFPEVINRILDAPRDTTLGEIAFNNEAKKKARILKRKHKSKFVVRTKEDTRLDLEYDEDEDRYKLPDTMHVTSSASDSSLAINYDKANKDLLLEAAELSAYKTYGRQFVLFEKMEEELRKAATVKNPTEAALRAWRYFNERYVNRNYRGLLLGMSDNMFENNDLSRIADIFGKATENFGVYRRMFLLQGLAKRWNKSVIEEGDLEDIVAAKKELRAAVTEYAKDAGLLNDDGTPGRDLQHSINVLSRETAYDLAKDIQAKRESSTYNVTLAEARGSITKAQADVLNSMIAQGRSADDISIELARSKEATSKIQKEQDSADKYVERINNLKESGQISEQMFEHLSNMDYKQGNSQLAYLTNRKKLEDDIFNHRIHGRMTEADAERLKQIKSNQELARSIQEVVVKQHNAIQNWHKLSKLYDFNNVYQTGYAQFNGVVNAATGIVPKPLLNIFQRGGAAMINGFEIDRAKYNYWMRTANTIKDTAAVAAGIVGTLSPGGPMMGWMAHSAVQGLGQAGIATWNQYLYGKERKFINIGQNVQNSLNTIGLLKSISGLDLAFSMLTKSVKVAAIGLTAMVVKGLHSMQNLATPLTSLSGVNYTGYQELERMDRILGVKEGGMNSTLNDFALQARRLYTYGQYNTDRLVAANMLGVFDKVYAQEGEAKDNYAAMVDAIMRNNPNGISKDTMSWAGMIDNTLPRILQVMQDLGAKNMSELYSKGGVYYRPLSDAERDVMRQTSMKYRTALAQTNNSMMRVGNAVWNNGLGGAFNMVNQWFDLLAEKAGIWMPKLNKGLKPLISAIDEFVRAFANGKDLTQAKANIGKALKDIGEQMLPTVLSIVSKITGGILSIWGKVVGLMGEKLTAVIGYLSTLRFDKDAFLRGDPNFLKFGTSEYRWEKPPAQGIVKEVGYWNALRTGKVTAKIDGKDVEVPIQSPVGREWMYKKYGATYGEHTRTDLSAWATGSAKIMEGKSYADLTKDEQAAQDVINGWVKNFPNEMGNIMNEVLQVLADKFNLHITIGDATTSETGGKEVPGNGTKIMGTTGDLAFIAGYSK